MQNKLFNPDSNSNIIRLFNSAKDLDSATKRNISEERLVEDRQSLSKRTSSRSTIITHNFLFF